MRKALLVTHVSGFVPQFEMNNVHILQNMGYECIMPVISIILLMVMIIVAWKEQDHLSSDRLERSPFKRKNITAYRQLKKLMEET